MADGYGAYLTPGHGSSHQTPWARTTWHYGGRGAEAAGRGGEFGAASGGFSEVRGVIVLERRMGKRKGNTTNAFLADSVRWRELDARLVLLVFFTSPPAGYTSPTRSTSFPPSISRYRSFPSLPRADDMERHRRVVRRAM
jgi:hypothetical protein